ncbi:MAG: hypothetical protein C4520_09080 [Candidatus Abyssobacteria bacterium SURF_5]|uniref:Penicillin-binding protein activator LpoB n=1 Tax=Abyssobacteria bacterium (strain SURF_5) TaxID=2093360 RepID=A0A3A4NXE5_ABYX5|nr:MAG: hypothetical protein C4520_09080 [Candidatus Abyssubacteria bacterium SURF_5]
MTDMLKQTRISIIVALGILLSLPACGSRTYVVRPAPEVVSFNRIAVFPFENLSGVPEGGDRMTSILISELHNANLVNVVEPGEVQQFILRSRIRFPSQLDVNSIREASRQLNADGIIFGTVNEYAVITTDLGPLPAVSASVRLVDAGTGEIVWSSTHSLQGDFKETFFGIGRVNSLGTLCEIVVEDLIAELGVAMYPELGRSREGVEWTSAEPKKRRSDKGPEPALPLSPTRTELQTIESEREKAHSDVLQEWQTIKGISD